MDIIYLTDSLITYSASTTSSRDWWWKAITVLQLFVVLGTPTLLDLRKYFSAYKTTGSIKRPSKFLVKTLVLPYIHRMSLPGLRQPLNLYKFRCELHIWWSFSLICVKVKRYSYTTTYTVTIGMSFYSDSMNNFNFIDGWLFLYLVKKKNYINS